jgi:glycosyltransferase involved in cell wall biosynthesis
MPLGQWELLLVDNCSRSPLSASVDLAWHPRGRHVREGELGLTPARLRGISESTAELIVFADDDNVLAPDYLERVVEIDREFPLLGAWGGQCLPGFQGGEPAEWTRPYWPLLAIHEVPNDVWGSFADFRIIPCGAGMAIRRAVAQEYAQRVASSPLRKFLDRRGKSLICCGDSDLALTACDLGQGVGRFSRLRLTHLIPRERLTEQYLIQLVEAIHCSAKLLEAVRGPVQRERRTGVQRLRRIGRLCLGGTRSRSFRFGIASERGRALADRLLAEFAHPGVADANEVATTECKAI